MTSQFSRDIIMNVDIFECVVCTALSNILVTTLLQLFFACCRDIGVSCSYAQYNYQHYKMCILSKTFTIIFKKHIFFIVKWNFGDSSSYCREKYIIVKCL